jgi:hypothetical protein
VGHFFLKGMYLTVGYYKVLEAGNSKKKYNTVTCQVQMRTGASGWATSAACSHQPTARVGRSRGSCCHLDCMTMEEAMTRRTSILKTGLMDEYATPGTGSETRTTSPGKSSSTETNGLSLQAGQLGG